MAFKSDSSEREAMSEINVTPLVDVMLVLLVVFIVTAPLLTQAVKVDLPKTEKTSPTPDDHLVTLAIDAQGQISLNDSPQAPDGLEAALRDRLAADPELTVHIQADNAVPYGRVAEAMALAHRAGIVRLAFITRE
jgi:biopolymer transport protein ExbD